MPSHSPETILLVAPAASYRIAAYLKAAQSLGVNVVIASPGKHSLIPAVFSGIHVDLADPSALELLLVASTVTPFDGVIATDDASVELASQIAEKLGLSGNSPGAAKISRRKDLARACLSQASVSVPIFKIIQLNHSLDEQLEGLHYPVVVKPVSLSASRGVIRADNKAECLEAIATIQEIFKIEHEIPGEEKQTILIERFIEGPEVAVEGVLHQGKFQLLAVFDKPDPMLGPYFEETYYITPSRLKEMEQKLVATTVAKACAAYGLKEGPVHAELRLADNQAWVMEVASRTIGGECARLLTYGTGEDLETLVIKKSLGRDVSIKRVEEAAGVMMLPIHEAGVLRRVEGMLAAQRVPHIQEVLISVREGYRLIPLPEGGAYLGFIFATAPTAKEVEAALREAYANLTVVVAPMFDLQDQR